MVLSHSEGRGLRYLRVANILRSRILEGDCPPGKRFPPQHDLARELNVSFSTLKHTLSILEEEGYVVPKVGDGTYAALPEKQISTALVVDDEEIIRDFFERVLSANRWTGVGAESGRAALERLSKQRFDLIFLDLVMPGMSGVDTFREIRRADPNAYVVIVTGYPDSAQMVAALDIGPFAVVKKPFTVDELLVVLKQASRSLEPRARARTDVMRDPMPARTQSHGGQESNR